MNQNHEFQICHNHHLRVTWIGSAIPAHFHHSGIGEFLGLITQIIATHSKCSKEVDGKQQINDASAQNKKEMPNIQCVLVQNSLHTLLVFSSLYNWAYLQVSVRWHQSDSHAAKRQNHRENRGQGVVLQSASTGKGMGGKCQHGKNRLKQQKSSLWRKKISWVQSKIMEEKKLITLLKHATRGRLQTGNCKFFKKNLIILQRSTGGGEDALVSFMYQPMVQRKTEVFTCLVLWIFEELHRIAQLQGSSGKMNHFTTKVQF